MKACYLDITGYWVVGASWKGPETWPQSSNDLKYSWELLLLHIYANFGGLISCGSKARFENGPCFIY